MSDERIETYLMAALDQEACKDTLTAALISRVEALRQNEIPVTEILAGLENMYDDPHQLNVDVIESVMEWVLAQLAAQRA